MAFLGTLSASLGNIDLDELRITSSMMGPVIYTLILCIFQFFLFPFFIILFIDDLSSYETKEKNSLSLVWANNDEEAQHSPAKRKDWLKEPPIFTDEEFCFLVKLKVREAIQKHQ